MTGIKSTLTTDQVIDLKGKLNANTQVSDLITKLGQTGLAAGFDAEKLINQENNDIRKGLSDAVKAVNPKYDINSVDATKATVAVQGVLDRFLSIMSAVDKLEKQSNDGAHTSVHTEVLHLRGLLNTVHWGKVQTADAEFTAITGSLAAIDAGVPAADGNKAIYSAKTAVVRAEMANVPAKRDALAQVFIDVVTLQNTYVYLPMNDTYVDDFQKNAKLFVNLDVGYAYVWRMDRGLAYSGFNIYFRPVDRSIPFREYDSFGDQMAARSSILIGITLASLEKNNVRKGFIGNQGLILGYGFRVISFFKINAGAMLNYRYDNNPLFSTNNYHTSVSPFVSFSIDLDAKSLLSGIGDSIFK